MTIAGVVGTVKQYGLDNEGKIVVYFPQQQNSDNNMYVVARASSDPASLAGPIIREIHAADPGYCLLQTLGIGASTMPFQLYAICVRQTNQGHANARHSLR